MNMTLELCINTIAVAEILNHMLSSIDFRFASYAGFTHLVNLEKLNVLSQTSHVPYAPYLLQYLHDVQRSLLFK